MAEFLKIAKLETGDVTKIKGLEKSLGRHIMAYQPGLQMANLTDEQIQSVKDVEEQLGAILLVFDD